MATQSERRESTRNALMVAARTLFAEHGYADVSVGQIGKDAGVTTGAIYHHFDSKEGIFRAVYDDLVASTAARIAEARRINPAPTLLADCELFFDACADPTYFRITADAPAAIGWDHILDDTQKFIAASLSAASERGEIRPDLPISSLARMLGAAFKEAGIMIATADDPAQARALASKSAGQLIAGLRLDRSNALHE
jgi:AcrR family transcriptional regulator